jgi:hypothetical protein
MPLYRKRSIILSPEKKPEKEKPERSKSEAESEKLRPGLERRLRAAKSAKSGTDSKSVSCKDLIETAKNTKNKFTLAAIELFEYAHIARSKNTEQAEKLANLIEHEINAQLRHEDLVAYSGSGKYFIYLPETAKTESTMVLERLSRHICRRSLKRPVAAQVSLNFKLIPLEAMTESTKSSEDEYLVDWFSRYRLDSSTDIEKEWTLLKAQDLWKDSRDVWIKRFDIPKKLTAETRKRLVETLTFIQINGLALFPHLIDFYISDTHVCLTILPVFGKLKGLHTSAKVAHNVLIAVCDLFIHLDSMTPKLVPPNISEDNFLAACSDNELLDLVYETLDSHMIASLSMASESVNDEEKAIAFTGFANLVKTLSKSHPSDECFSATTELLDQLSSKKNLAGSLQKIRATLKRHEERLRRAQPS